jgi:Short repeat of unknown function (DUF308)
MTIVETETARMTEERWLKRYYFVRAAFSATWVALALTVGRGEAAVASVLLIAYPAWDALANYIDASQSGGLRRNRPQAMNVAVSLIATAAVIIALQSGMNGVLGVFGGWAIFSGLLQLATAVQRWKDYGAQWAMILSGGQSALAGAFFIAQARMSEPPSISHIIGYAGVGALYFLISAVWLSVREARSKPA